MTSFVQDTLKSKLYNNCLDIKKSQTRIGMDEDEVCFVLPANLQGVDLSSTASCEYLSLMAFLFVDTVYPGEFTHNSQSSNVNTLNEHTPYILRTLEIQQPRRPSSLPSGAQEPLFAIFSSG